MMIIFSIMLQCGAAQNSDSGMGYILLILMASVSVGFAGFAVYIAASDLKKIPATVRASIQKMSRRDGEQKDNELEESHVEIAHYPTDEPEQGPQPEITGNDICFPIAASAIFLGFEVDEDMERRS